MNKQNTKVRWSKEETQQFLELVPQFGTNYQRYTEVLDRSYSCIKGQYHNLKRNGVISQDCYGCSAVNSPTQLEKVQPPPARKTAKEAQQEADDLVAQLKILLEKM